MRPGAWFRLVSDVPHRFPLRASLASAIPRLRGSRDFYHGLLALLSLLLPTAAPGALFHHRAAHAQHSQAISLRKRVHVNTLITEPGTMDFEWGTAVSVDGSFTFPTAIHYTPEGSHAWWGRTEFNVAFDSLSYNEVNHFGDRISAAAVCVVHDGDRLDIAFSPSVTYLLRGDEGIRAGATAIARYDVGHSSMGVTMTWTGATNPSPTNPAGIFDAGAGYGYHLKSSGPLSHFTPHVNWLYEKATGNARQISLFEGVEYQVSDPVGLDFAVQHISLWGNQPDTQYVVGLTINTGHLRRH
ncbi:MAG: hypothetical protein ABI759_13810 [Candidatus Solibacter sp.]